ncbi:MAG: nucleoside triphosphate pyrophosphohydrolase [Inconstantimicrobium porci]|uniref:Nucleoside triphosphate pyrophosphohydrolase n=1 Tax=Inconstantimicrobium porci TaxID=2652291 RepID=A0A7X2T0H4_9CLOT|nr:nucleoside triphosphate pyrophosphohydrolase [Inconstantimicrobium porci]MDD6770088.1 nucleoside triphosphate pyrophosphohydrolase [Inconstantimicrobium porci]MDY5910530.1 nucleoside triphosphate pyrophosphohydrolase [Inconstantimicrobium porci]MSR90524.1 nucleoside triphosphate pyrophosphohydrolase [Inconstantimicrobium porci]
MKKYDKLVRDLIPEIINNTGKKCDFEIVHNNELTDRLEEKLKEEVNEYIEDKNIEELADIMEVLFGLAKNMGYTEEELIHTRNEKLKERGGFKNGLVLKRVYE